MAGVVRGNAQAFESGFEFRPAPYQLSDLSKSLNLTEPHLRSDSSNGYFPGFYL